MPVDGELAAGATTTTENGPTDAALLPLLAVMVIFAAVPTLLSAGVPLKAPVLELKLAHAGFREIVKVTAAVAGDTVGWNEYLVPAMTLVGGDPCKAIGVVVVVVVEVLPEVPLGVLPVTAGPEHPPKINAMTINPAVRGHDASCAKSCMLSLPLF